MFLPTYAYCKGRICKMGAEITILSIITDIDFYSFTLKGLDISNTKFLLMIYPKTL